MHERSKVPVSDEVRAHDRAVKFETKIAAAASVVHCLVNHKNYDRASLIVSLGGRSVEVYCCSCESCGGDVYRSEDITGEDVH